MSLAWKDGQLDTSDSGTGVDSFTIDNDTLFNIVVGDLIAVFVKWEDVACADVACVDSGGVNVYVGKTTVNGANIYGKWFYCIATSAVNNATWTITFVSNSVNWTRGIVHVFTVDSGETVTIDIEKSGVGTGTAMSTASGNTTGNDEVVLCGYGEYSSGTVSAMNLANTTAGVVAYPASQPATITWTWYKLYTATVAAMHCDATLSGSAEWLLSLISFKSAAAAADALGWMTDGQSNRPLPHHLDKGVYVGY